MTREERLAAYVDGELASADREAFERELASDPSLQDEVSRQRALRARLSAAFDPVLDEPVPLRLALAAQTANVGRGAWRPAHWAAMAACLVVGVGLGRALLVEEGPLRAGESGLMLQGEVARTLDRRLAADAGPVQVGLTFRTAEGDYCRTFQSTPDRLAGVACRDADDWVARAVTAWRPPAGNAYRTAGAETPGPLLAAVDELIAGEPLDAPAERAARDQGWRR